MNLEVLKTWELLCAVATHSLFYAVIMGFNEPFLAWNFDSTNCANSMNLRCLTFVFFFVFCSYMHSQIPPCWEILNTFMTVVPLRSLSVFCFHMHSQIPLRDELLNTFMTVELRTSLVAQRFFMTLQVTFVLERLNTVRAFLPLKSLFVSYSHMLISITFVYKSLRTSKSTTLQFLRVLVAFTFFMLLPIFFSSKRFKAILTSYQASNPFVKFRTR